MSLRILFLFILSLGLALGSNILCLMGVPSPSHHIWNRSIMEAVAAKGHNLTILSVDIEENPPPNMHYIHLEKVYSFIYDDSDEPLNLIEMANGGPLSELVDYYKFGTITMEGIFKSEIGLQKIYSYPKNFKFDLVIHDFTIGPGLLGILQHFDYYPPVVSVSAFSIPPFSSAVIGGHKFPAYIPYYSLNYDMNMNFWQRCVNTFMYSADALYRYYVSTANIDKIMRSNYKVAHLPYARKLEQKTILMLVNTHPAIDFPEPLPPNVIGVAGLQVKAPKPLPDNFKKFMEAAKKGVILVSLGTNIRSDQLDNNRLLAFLWAMEHLPDYNFIWKFESDSLPAELPKNVMIIPWLPQNDVLGHPKTKAFITHSGLLGTHEAVWHGVPMVGIPFLADQHRNQRKMTATGISVKVTFQTMTGQKLKNALIAVLEDPSYRQNMKKMSQRFRDQPELPITRAVWWIEWALRNPNADHIASPTLKLGFLKSNSYDVLFAIILAILVVVYSIKKLVRTLFGGGRKETKSKANKKKD